MKNTLIHAINAFISQRSGIDGRNYGGSREAFLSDYRPILKHGKQARQLLAFVRVFLQDPKIVILDEATSSIDTESELLIQRATELLTKDRTSIVIAHRLSTIQQADVIFVLEKGEIIEQGSHSDLMTLSGHYRNLVELQYKK
jgi:ABC-type transport system involved in Fe-S cluster assembly fused permease/ATPase subunit